MEKRLIFTIALSLLVLMSWSALISKVYHIDNKEVKVGGPALKSAPLTPAPVLVSPKEVPESKLLKLAQEKTEIVFNESEAAVQEVVFKDYQSAHFNLQRAFALPDPEAIFTQKEPPFQNEAVFVHSDKNKQITKRFIFSNSNYHMKLEIEIRNLSNLPIQVNLPLVLGVLNFSGDPAEARFQDVTVATPEKDLHPNVRKDSAFGEIKFLGLRNRYFCAIIEPVQKNNYTAWIKKSNSHESIIGLNSKAFSLEPAGQITQKFHIYLGPQELRTINQINPEWTVVMHYGAFNFISHLLLQLLEFIYRIVHNWGLAIVILSLVIYLVLYPLTLKQMRSMKEMQALQPAIEELRRVYKDNPQKLNKEIMVLYREHKVNPFGGCLPLILQIPIFFALYQALMRSIALKGAKFLWIKDLSQPDRLFTLPMSLPILGNEINILPIVMAIGMFVQQKFSTPAATGPAAEQQKIMLFLFPIMFGFIFYHMPAGLVLYWFINSGLMLIYQLRLRRKPS